MMVPSAQVLRMLSPRSFPLSGTDLRLHRRHNRVRNLILNGEKILNWSIVPFCPKMRVGLRVDELCGNSHARPSPANAAFEHIAYAQFPPDLLDDNRFAFVS